MSAMGPNDVKAYLAYNYFLYYANKVPVLTPVVYGPPRIGKTETVRDSLKMFVKAIAYRIVANDFLGLRPPEVKGSLEQVRQALAGLVEVFKSKRKDLILSSMEESGEEELNFALIFALAEQCDAHCERLARVIAASEKEVTKDFYLDIINTGTFLPTRENLKYWDDGIVEYNKNLDISEMDDKVVYVEINANELTKEDLKGYPYPREGFFEKLPPRWAEALGTSMIGLLHIENGLTLPLKELEELIMVTRRKRIGMYSFNKLAVITGPDPNYAESTIVPSYLSSGNLAFVEMRPPTVLEWKEMIEGEYAEEVYYFLEATSAGYGLASTIEALKFIPREVSKVVAPKDTFIPPPEVAKEYKNHWKPYPTPKAWMYFAKALEHGRVEATSLAFTYIADESVAELFASFLPYYWKVQMEGPQSILDFREDLEKNLAARVAVAAHVIKALETGEGRDELAKVLEEVGWDSVAGILREGFTE